MLLIFLKVLVVRMRPILVYEDIWQLGLAASVRNSAIFEHISSCNACNHSTIENFIILSHGSNDFDNNVTEALFIKKQKPL